jgi:hypothetical protein
MRAVVEWMITGLLLVLFAMVGIAGAYLIGQAVQEILNQ